MPLHVFSSYFIPSLLSSSLPSPLFSPFLPCRPLPSLLFCSPLRHFSFFFSLPLACFLLPSFLVFYSPLFYCFVLSSLNPSVSFYVMFHVRLSQLKEREKANKVRIETLEHRLDVETREKQKYHQQLISNQEELKKKTQQLTR